jgi:hypothetical protein
MKIPIGTVRSRLSRGRDMLRRLMGMENEIAVEPLAVDLSAIPRAEISRAG